MQDFLEKLSVIEQAYKEKTYAGDINIFNILFYGHEEVTLHSRFISYLLSSNPAFLEVFVRDILKIENEKFDTKDCEVIPNEKNKSEYEEIDILIINEKEKQAIIIENKIHAEPSIHKGVRKGYEGQLERYYNTITKGEDKNEKKCKYKCDEDKTYVYYLTLYKEPTDETIGELKEKGIFDSKKHKIDYYQIQEWLELCVDKKEKSFFNTIIQQYLNLIKKMTTDNEKALAITNLISENENYWQSAYVFSKHFKDVKWHAIHRFFKELSDNLNAQMPDDELITEVSHYSKKNLLTITFKYNNIDWYIANDPKEGLTYGYNITQQEKEKGRNWFTIDSEIKFSEFDNEETFHIINNEYRSKLIEKIIAEIISKNKL